MPLALKTFCAKDFCYAKYYFLIHDSIQKLLIVNVVV